MNSTSEFINWFERQQAASDMQVLEKEDVPEGWQVSETSPLVSRKDGLFFDVPSIAVGGASREVPYWEQAILREKHHGALAMLSAQIGEKIMHLVHANPEPGNFAKGKVLLGPTIQGSVSNLRKAHGGSAPGFTGLLADQRISWAELPAQPYDGGRNLDKVNLYFHGWVVDVNAYPQLAPDMLPDNYRWAESRHIDDLLNETNQNSHPGESPWATINRLADHPIQDVSRVTRVNIHMLRFLETCRDLELSV